MKRKLLLSILLFGAMSLILTGCDEEKQETKKKEEPKMDYLVLVNKQNKLPDYWEDVVELAEDKDAWGDKVLVEKHALERFKELEKDLEKENIDIELDSIYRTVKEQQEIWDKFEKEYGIDYVKKYVAVPGYSEHHTGLAIDICIKKNGKIIADNDEMIAEEKIFAKIHKKLADYGFILRYPKGRDGVTGYSYEPWHFRYVGETVAKEIAKENITFEEYLGKATLGYTPEKGKITSVCKKTEKIDDVKVSTVTTYNYDKNQLATNMMVKTSYVYEDKDQYEYNKKEMKKSLLENYDSELIQDFLFNDKKQRIETLFVYKELEIPKKEKKKYSAKEIVASAEKNDSKCEITGSTRKDLGLE